MKETLSTDADGRTVLRMERLLAHPPAKVWRALTDPKELSQWFPMVATQIDLRVGGAVRLDFGSDPLDLGSDSDMPGDSLQDMIITEVEAPRVFEFMWDKDLLRWELYPDAGGCLLIFIHTFDDRAGAASFASGWHECINAMETLLRGESIPDALPSAGLHDSYVDAFGLDTGVAEDTDDGWLITFERQLTAPAERAWTTLAATAPEVGTEPPEPFTADAVRPGLVTRADAPVVLEYEWLAGGRPAGTVRWELRDDRGTGHGARLFLTQNGGTESTGERDAALEGWRTRIQRLTEQLR